MKRNSIVIQMFFCLLCFFALVTGANAAELTKEQKAEIFNDVVSEPIWCEATVNSSNRTYEKSKKIALMGVEFDSRRIIRGKVIETRSLQIPQGSVDFSSIIKVIDEDTSGNYGKEIVVIENGNEVPKITFRFKMQCQEVKDINPFISKEANLEKGFIKDFKETESYWEFVGVGHGFYESFEDIDSKNRLAGKMAKDSGCEAIINKVIELGITDKNVHEKMVEQIKAKRNYGGIYWVRGCGVKFDMYLPIRISKEDYSVSFLYN